MSAFEYFYGIAKVDISLFEGLPVADQAFSFRIIEIVLDAIPIAQAFAKIFRKPAADNTKAQKQESESTAFQGASNSLQELLARRVVDPELQRLAVDEANRVGRHPAKVSRNRISAAVADFTSDLQNSFPDFG